MRLIVVMLFVLNPVIAWASDLCPAQIDISENIQTVPSGFRTYLQDNTWPRPLIGLDFYDGRLENLVLQEPQSMNNHETIWHFFPNHPIWIVCRYKDSGLTLTRQLLPKTAICTTNWRDPQNGTLVGQRLVSSTTCW